MLGRLIRAAAWLVLLVWVPWELFSDTPDVLLFIAFVAIWGLFIDMLIHLPRDFEKLRRWREEKKA